MSTPINRRTIIVRGRQGGVTGEEKKEAKKRTNVTENKKISARKDGRAGDDDIHIYKIIISG